MLNVLYFASLREAFGKPSEHISSPLPTNVEALILLLRARGGVWSESLGADKRWRVAVNQEMASMETALNAGDEIAIFPPVTGG